MITKPNLISVVIADCIRQTAWMGGVFWIMLWYMFPSATDPLIILCSMIGTVILVSLFRIVAMDNNSRIFSWQTELLYELQRGPYSKDPHNETPILWDYQKLKLPQNETKF